MLRRALTLPSLLLLPLIGSACASSSEGDAGVFDAGLDAGAGDAALGDGGAGDAGPRDAGDAGPSTYSWTGRRACGGPAWAVGTLEKATVADLATRTFTPDTILWLDAAPPALPDVGALLVGTSSLSAALKTAAAAAHVPLLAWTGPASLELEAVVGRELILYATYSGLDADPSVTYCEVHVDDVTGLLDAEDRAAVEAARLAPAEPRSRIRLVPRPTSLCAVGQETTNVWALHRSQPSLSRLLPAHVWLGGDPVVSPHAELDLTHRLGVAIVRNQGAFSALQNASFTHDDAALRDSWTGSDVDGRATFALELPTSEPLQLAQAGLPIAVYDHFAARFAVTWASFRDDPGAAQPVRSESVDLWPCAWIAANGLQTRFITLPGIGELEYEVEVGGPSSRTYFTSPITRVVSARLSGLVRDDVVFDGSAGVSASADHHNFSERLVLEPRRDPSIPTALLDDLTAHDILVVYVEVDLGLSSPNTATAVWIQGRLGWRRVL